MSVDLSKCADCHITQLCSYRYKALTSHDSVRLVGLSRSGPSSPIICGLAEFQLQNTTDCLPKYQALSYAWGNDIKRHEIITCDLTWGERQGRPLLLPDPSSFSLLKITENLHQALLHIAPSELVDTKWFYIDALCIDQQNDREKSQQVALMAEIFSGASIVRAWLGLADDMSSKAFDWVMAQFSRYANWKGDKIPDPLTQMTTEQYQAFMATFTSSGDRKWWERRWVVQEVSLAREVILQCGSRMLAWDYLADVCRIIRLDFQATIRSGNFENRPRVVQSIELDENIMLSNTISSIYELRKIEDNEPLFQGRSPLLMSLNLFHSYKFSNPYDAVYAVLALCRSGNHRIKPDYSKPLLDVYLDATEVMLLDAHDLDALCMRPLRLPEGKNNLRDVINDCPSWIPVEDIRRRERSPWHNNGGLLPETLRFFSADARRSLSSDFLSTDRRCLKLEGFLFDFVQEFLPQASEGSGNVMLEVPGVPHDAYRVKESYLRTLCCDCAWNMHGPALRRLSPSDYCRCEQTMNAGLQVVGAGDSQPNGEQYCHFRKEKDISECVDWLLPTLYQQRIARLCTTRAGRYAWVRADAVEGDLLAIVLGSRAPVTLRRAQRENHFTFLGAAYVSGVMDGELMKEPNAEKKITSIILE